MKTVTIVVILIGVGAYLFYRFGNPFKAKKAEQPVKSSTPSKGTPVKEEKQVSEEKPKKVEKTTPVKEEKKVLEEKPTTTKRKAPAKKRAPRKNNTKKSNTNTNTRRGRPSNPKKK